MSNDDPTPPSPRQVLLGIFVVGQLAFLFVGNLLGFVKWVPTDISTESQQRINQVLPQFGDQKGHGWEWTDEIETNLRRYVQLTGQDQDWALFAPTVGKATAFPAVLFRWDEAAPFDRTIAGAEYTFNAKNGFHMRLDADAPRTEILQSENEPKDVRAYFRFNKCRVRRVEGQFWLNPQPNKDEGPEEVASRLTRRVQKFAKEYHEVIVEYLHWRLKAWQASHPGEPSPKQVILLERFYRIHDPGEERGWDEPVVFPVARWLPKLQRSEHTYVLESFDFTDKQFVVLK
jgi:hypothetical protein